jgi:hypothetical protein
MHASCYSFYSIVVTRLFTKRSRLAIFLLYRFYNFRISTGSKCCAAAVEMAIVVLDTAVLTSVESGTRSTLIKSRQADVKKRLSDLLTGSTLNSHHGGHVYHSLCLYHCRPTLLATLLNIMSSSSSSPLLPLPQHY